MNSRTAKLMGHVASTLVQSGADKPRLPNGPKNTLFNHLANLKRKLKREWNAKARNIRGRERLGVIRTLIAVQGAPA